MGLETILTLQRLSVEEGSEEWGIKSTVKIHKWAHLNIMEEEALEEGLALILITLVAQAMEG